MKFSWNWEKGKMNVPLLLQVEMTVWCIRSSKSDFAWNVLDTNFKTLVLLEVDKAITVIHNKTKMMTMWICLWLIKFKSPVCFFNNMVEFSTFAIFYSGCGISVIYLPTYLFFWHLRKSQQATEFCRLYTTCSNRGIITIRHYVFSNYSQCGIYPSRLKPY